jgi:hypothetical protein
MHVPWTIQVAFTAAAFAAGQALIRVSKMSSVTTAHVFIASMGLVALVGGLVGLATSAHRAPCKELLSLSTMWPAVVAGVVFYVGNVAWVFALKKAPNLGLVGVLQNGLQMGMVLVVALVLFSHRLTARQGVLTAVGVTCMVAAAF